jgi:hypothetical protein
MTTVAAGAASGAKLGAEMDHPRQRARAAKVRAESATLLARTYVLLGEASRLCDEGVARCKQHRRERWRARSFEARRRPKSGKPRRG